MKDKLLGLAENFSKAMVQPLMYLAIVGLLITAGVLLTNQTLKGFLPFLNFAPIQLVGNLVYNSAMFIIQNLSVIFAVGIAASMAKSEKHQAALITLIVYFMYLISMQTYLSATGSLVPVEQLQGSGQTMTFGIQVLDTGVLAGMIIGALSAYIFNRTCDKEFKGAKQLYSGTRYSLICLMGTTILLGVGMTFIWPSIQSVISLATGVISKTGTFGIFLYGFLDRILIPTGLHHLVYTPFMFSELGGVVESGGQVYAGSVPILMMQMNDPSVTSFHESIIYNAPPLSKMFGLMGAALALYHTARPENKNKVKAILLPAAIASVLAGITEPLEFAFLFAAPILFFSHAVMAGAGLALLKFFNVTTLAGGGIINVIVLNLLMGVEKTNYPMFFLIGILQAVAYYFVFKFLILKLNLKTLGREVAKEEKSEFKLLNFGEKIPVLIKGLGGKDNILSVTNCFTRLRVEVKDINLVDEDLINQLDNSGVVKKGNNVQIIYGLQVQTIRKSVDKFILVK